MSDPLKSLLFVLEHWREFIRSADQSVLSGNDHALATEYDKFVREYSGSEDKFVTSFWVDRWVRQLVDVGDTAQRHFLNRQILKKMLAELGITEV